MGNVSKYSQTFLRKYASNVQSLVISFLSVEQSPRAQETSSWARIVDGKLPSNPPTPIPAVDAPVADTDYGVPDPMHPMPCQVRQPGPLHPAM